MTTCATSKGYFTQTLLSEAEYLPFGPLKSLDWGNGQPYDSTFDQDYRLKTQTTTGLADRGYGYDAADNIDDITVNGQLRNFAYDELERLKREQTIAGPVINYQYDGNGNREDKSDANQTILDDYSYEPDSNRLQSIVGQQNEVPILDTVGNLKQDSRFSYTYDAFGRLTDITGEGKSIEYAYNARHQRVRKSVNGKNTYFQYDDSGRLLVEQNSQGQPIREYIYLGMRPVGQLGGESTASSVQLTGTNTENFTETGTATVTTGDNASLSFTTSGGYSFTATADELTIAPSGNSQRVTFNRNNAEGSIQAILNVSPDAPPQSQGVINYQFDSSYSGNFNYPVQFSGNTLTVGASDGSEAKATFNNDNTMTLAFNGRSVTFTPNQRYLARPYGYFVVFAHNANGLQVNGFASGTYGSIQITENRTVSGSFQLYGVAPEVTDEATPLYYLHTDQLATIHAITDKEQAIVWQGEHDAFGQTYATISQLDNPLRFPGQYFDSETGLHYNWHRYYNPATGRYVSSDPIGLMGGLNTFGYAYQNSLRHIDPDGRIVPQLLGAAFGAGFELYNQLSSNGGDWSNLNYGKLVMAGLTGSVGGFAGGITGGIIRGAFSGATNNAYQQLSDNGFECFNETELLFNTLGGAFGGGVGELGGLLGSQVKNYDDAVIDLVGAPSGWKPQVTDGKVTDYGAHGSAIGGVTGGYYGNEISSLDGSL